LNVYLDVSVGLKTVQFHISGNFPETAWRVLKAAKWLIPFCAIQGSWRRKCMAAHTWLPGDT